MCIVIGTDSQNVSDILHTPYQLTAVRDNEPSEVPLLPQQFGQQLTVGTRRHTVDGIVAAHVGEGAGIPTSLEGRLEGLDPVSVTDHGIKASPWSWDILRACVHIEVLASGLKLLCVFVCV